MDIKIYNEDCFETMKRFQDKSIDVILTSPPYNINTSIRGHKMYDAYSDTKTEEEYAEWTKQLFLEFDRIVVNNGVICYNLSYSPTMPNLMWRTLNKVTSETPWSTVETITWKKPNATPNNSRDVLTRICELVFIFARDDEVKTFNINKRVIRQLNDNTTFYNTDFYNFIEAPNNDGVNWLNKATYSTSLCEQLLNIYAPPKSLVYDPFMGSGSTGKAAMYENNDRNKDYKFVGIELTDEYLPIAQARILYAMGDTEPLKVDVEEDVDEEPKETYGKFGWDDIF